MDSVKEEKKEFVCTRCGCCCKNIKNYEPAEFLDRGDGVCKYYDEANKACTIYDFRPEICRVDKMYKLYKDKMTWNEYVDLNYESCEELRKIEKINKFKEIYPGKLRYYYENGDMVGEEDLISELAGDKIVVNKAKEEYLFEEDMFEGE